jgi:hypothetical protein
MCVDTVHKGENYDDDDNNNNNNNNNVPQSVETIHEGKVTILWNQQLTELSLTINRT